MNQLSMEGYNGEFNKVNIDKVRELVENNAYIIDARESGKYNNRHIKLSD